MMEYRNRYYLKIMLTVLGICLLSNFSQAQQQALGALYGPSNQQLNEFRIKKGMSLRQALEKIEKRFGVVFLYRTDAVENQKIFDTIYLANDVEKALGELLKGKQLQFKQLNRKTYGIYPEDKSVPNKKNVLAETVSGRVTDSSTGEALAGVNIKVKATTTGTFTNGEGHYELEVASLQDTLVFSFVGYQSQEVPIDGRMEINVKLVSQALTGEELVVVGYGTQKKSDLTGSISSLSSKDFNSGVNNSVDQLMQGRSAGVQINQTTGEPGGGMSVRIRGSSSITAGNEPLYVIDGMPIDNSPLQSGGGTAGLGPDQNPRNPLSSLNPNDIESIEILKDASATAIYGARGANGVVLITTKGGEQGKVKVSYSGYTGVQSTARRLDILTAKEYLKVINGISEDAGNGSVFSESEINKIGNGTNWLDQIYRTAPVTSHDISVSGGNDNTTYRVSLNYFNQEGIVKKSGIKKYIARVNVESNMGEKTHMGIHLNHSFVDNNNDVDGTSFEEQGGPVASALFYDPTIPVYNEDGSYALSSSITINNPVAILNGVTDFNKVNRTFGNVYFSYNILNNLEAKLNFGYDNHASKQDIYNSRLTKAGAASGGIASISTLDNSNINIEYTMHFDKQLSENHSITVLGGITYQKFDNTLFTGSIQGFPSDQTKTNNLGLGDTQFDNLNSNENVNKLFSYLGRINYNAFDKYLLTASLRADGSSRFGGNNKYGYFPSFALAWKLAEEKFIPSFFDDLKLRASWGITGNQEIGNYNYLSTLAPSGHVVYNNSDISAIAPTRIANPNLKWESTKQFDIGLDASILDDRLSGTLDYFVKNTSDLLINRPLPRSSGYGTILSNIGQMENKGIEIQINSTNIQTHNFNWNTTLNFSSVKNNVKDIGDIQSIITGAIKATGNTSIVTVGAPLFSYYGYRVEGIFQKGDDIANSAQPNAQPGYPIFKDVNSDNKITPDDDRVILGNPYPTFTFGISNSLSYKNFQFSFFITGSQGSDLANANVMQSIYPKNPRRNILAEVGLNRWTPDNPNTKWPSGVNSTDYGGGQKLNSLSILDASYIQLKNIRLSYNIPQNFIQSAEVYVSGQNLLTITDYLGTNPNANVLGNSNVHIDFSNYPLARIFLLGINLNF